MTKQHEVLAVEANKEGIAKNMMAETVDIFKNKHSLLQGGTKILKMLGDSVDNLALEEANSVVEAVATTVPTRLGYTQTSLVDWLDVVLQKESTNQVAVADLIVEGETVATGLPATFLLGLESKLGKIKDIYSTAPTLDPKVDWEKEAEEEEIYRSKNPDVKTKTQKTPVFTIIAEATQQHKAQVDKGMEETVVGKYTTTIRSGMITPAKKAAILKRVDLLIQAVKQARQRANNVDIVDVKVGSSLFDYING